jgi:hypothetical protein
LEESKKSLESGFAGDMKRLDDILTSAQKQIEALEGIESAILSLADSIDNFQAAINVAMNGGSGGAGGAGGAGGGASVSDAEIKAFVEANKDNPQLIHSEAIKRGISAERISQATGIPLADINATIDTLGLPRLPDQAPVNTGQPVFGITDQLVSNFYQANKNDPLKVAKEALKFDVNVTQLSRSTGFSVKEINEFMKSQGLPLLDQKGFAAGGFTGAGGKFEPAGIVHAGEYVFSQEAVKNIGVNSLEQLHQVAKHGTGFAEGGLVSMGSNVINAVDRFTTERQTLNDESNIQLLARNMQLDQIGKFASVNDERNISSNRLVNNSVINAADIFRQRESLSSSKNVTNFQEVANISKQGIRELENNLIRQEEIISLIEEKMVAGSDVQNIEAPAAIQSINHSESISSDREELIEVIREIIMETKSESSGAPGTDYAKQTYDLLQRVTLGGTKIRTTTE